jgi:hypothetical protein
MFFRHVLFAVCGCSISASAVIAGPDGPHHHYGSSWGANPEAGSGAFFAGNGGANSMSLPSLGFADQRPLGFRFGGRASAGASWSLPEDGSRTQSPVEIRFGENGGAGSRSSESLSPRAILLNPVVATQASYIQRQGSCEKPPACVRSTKPSAEVSAWERRSIWTLAPVAVVQPKPVLEWLVSVQSSPAFVTERAVRIAKTRARPAKEFRALVRSEPRVVARSELNRVATMNTWSLPSPHAPQRGMHAAHHENPAPRETPKPMDIATLPPESIQVDSFISDRQ